MTSFFLLLLAACGGGENALKASDSAGDVEDTAGPDTGETDADEEMVATWFTVRAEAEVAAGVPVLTDLTFIVVDQDAFTVVCEIAGDPTMAVAVTSPDPAVAWWISVPVLVNEADCAMLPPSLGLGIGELPIEVRAQLGPAGLSSVAASLFGAFGRAPDDSGSSVAAFGYAGTSLDLAGDDVATLPPPDGLYVLNPLFLLPLPAEG